MNCCFPGLAACFWDGEFTDYKSLKLRVLFSEQIVQIWIESKMMLVMAMNLLRIVNKDYISLTLVFCLMPGFAYIVS